MSAEKTENNGKKSWQEMYIRWYRSPAGKLFYSTRLCRLDWLGILLVFCLTSGFAMLAGKKATDSGYIGDWYAYSAAPVAISIYNTGKLGTPLEPGAALDNFMNRGSRGEKDYYSITGDEAETPLYTRDYLSETGSTAIPFLVAVWWWIIGHPDWSTVYILFALLYGLTIIAAYFALRQVTGILPSVFLGLLMGAYPSTMHQFIFKFRDGARALLCYIAIAIFLYLLKRGLNWKGTIICSFLLYVICSLFNMFRNDFIVFIPFIAIAAVFFHGKILHNVKKKAVIVLSIVLGLAAAAFVLPKEKTVCGFGHVLYVGMADRPFMDYLYFSSDNYTKAIPFSDFYGFMVASGKAYRDRGELNLPPYSAEYDREIKKELYSLIEIYPYDFLRLALSSCIQSFRTGSICSERLLYYVGSAPGYRWFQEKARGFYSNVPGWLYFEFFVLTALLFLGGRFYANILLCLAFMCMGGCYLFQFDIRHFFFLIIVPLLSCGFVLSRAARIVFLFGKDRKRFFELCKRNKNVFLIHCAVAAGLFGLAVCVLQSAKAIQETQIKREIAGFSAAKTEKIKFENETEPSLINGFSAADVILPDFCQSVLDREDPQQIDFTEFLKIRFKVNGEYKKEQIFVFAEYENTAEYSKQYPLLDLSHFICNYTKTCPVPYCFYVRQGTNTLYFPVYFSRGYSPLTGIQLVAGGKTIEIESVERIAETENIHSQSAFLIPDDPEDIRYFGRIKWGKVLWEKNHF